MSMLIYVVLLLTIIAYQSIRDRRAYKLDQLKKTTMKAQLEHQEQEISEELSQKKAFQKGTDGHYEITYRESLTPIQNPETQRARKSKPISQS
ncbi:hypothetical protein GO755_12475 [Spirosoma sp. HMF4905]|uniref:Uncharacterized protein n=1 Tax=Spirosoma arboris TaxID=2682092 RepID=A0A7K1SAL3_9BACT|nr:hypothetical protein [Spirosoma arboris]MVM30849.1 hypothetical protein [Spirosoma arboris]